MIICFVLNGADDDINLLVCPREEAYFLPIIETVASFLKIADKCLAKQNYKASSSYISRFRNLYFVSRQGPKFLVYYLNLFCCYDFLEASSLSELSGSFSNGFACFTISVSNLIKKTPEQSFFIHIFMQQINKNGFEYWTNFNKRLFVTVSIHANAMNVFKIIKDLCSNNASV